MRAVDKASCQTLPQPQEKEFLMFRVALLISVCSVLPANANECDAALIKAAFNAETKTHNDWRLSLLVTQDNFEYLQKDFAGKATIYGVPYSANYNEYSQKRNQLFQSHLESRTVDEARNLAWSGLDPTAAQAYTICVTTELFNRPGLQAAVVSSTDTDIVVMVNWSVPGKLTANVTWDPPSIKGKTFPILIKQGLTPVTIPRPDKAHSIVVSTPGFSAKPITVGPLPPVAGVSRPSCIETATNIVIAANTFDRSRNVGVGSFGDFSLGTDVIHDGPPFGIQPNNAQYDITIPCGGRYLLQIEYASGENRRADFKLKNSNYTITRTVLKDVTGSWTVPVLIAQGFLDIPKGNYTLELDSNIWFPHIKSIQFMPID
jgi:hypothetical protein